MDAGAHYSLQLFWESWDYFREATVAGTIGGLMLGFLGGYIVLRKMVFLSAALSQASGLGVAYAFYLQIYWGASGHQHAFGGATDSPWWAALLGSPLLGAAVAALLVTAVLALAAPRLSGRSMDALLGLIYLLGSAGILALGTRIVEEVQDIQTILFGNAVVVLDEDLRLLAFTAVGVLGLHLLLMRGFIQASFDAEGARVRAMPVRALNLGLFVSIAIAVSVATRVLGALPVFAFSVLPAMAAQRIAPNVQMTLIIAALLGAVAAFWGYVAAFLYELPVGAAQTLVAVGIVAVVEVLVHAGRLARRGWKWWRRPVVASAATRGGEDA